MGDNIVIQVKGVSKDFILPHAKANSIKSILTGFYKKNAKLGKEVQHALNDVSFEIKEGEFFGIVGRNGSGKSTLLKILAGIYQPTVGRTAVKGRLVPFIELGVGFNPELTGRENVFLNGAMLGFSNKEVESMYEDIVEFAELGRFMDQKLKNYSSGMQVRLAFSLATRAEADILLVDEILAVGDLAFQRKCFEYFHELKRQKKTVVFVGHDMGVIREYCDRAVLIDKSRLIMEGDAGKIADAYMEMFMREERGRSSAAKSGNNKRFGSGEVKYSTVECLPRVVGGDDKKVTLRLAVQALEGCDEVVAGFRVRTATGAHLMGSNTRLESREIKDLDPGTELVLEWELPNIFNDGKYFVDISLQSESRTTYDWWNEALSFEVMTNSQTGFVIKPDIKLKVKV